MYCGSAVGEVLDLKTLMDCQGSICEGIWNAEAANTGMTYDACNNTVTIDTDQACGKFILESDGTGANAQCGAFIIEVNISVAEPPAATAFAIQPSCTDGNPNDDGYL